MTRVIVNESLENELGRTDTTVELCGRGGRILGHFVPARHDLGDPMQDCPFSEHELEALLRQSGGRELPEILNTLRAS